MSKKPEINLTIGGKGKPNQFTKKLIDSAKEMGFTVIENPKKKYPVIKVPANGKPNWIKGARTMCFVYSKHHGNFILEGYLGEVEEYLKKNHTHYFYYRSMWCQGNSRGSWMFWKENIGIFSPYRSKVIGIQPKYIVKKYSWLPAKSEKELTFKRLPKRWIPEFDEF